MAQGPLAAAGGLYEADMVANSLASAGVAAGALGAALDFGCSSGRVLRVLQLMFGSVRHGGSVPGIIGVSEPERQARNIRQPSLGARAPINTL